MGVICEIVKVWVDHLVTVSRFGENGQLGNGGLHSKINSAAEKHRKSTIHPEQHIHDLPKPWSCHRVIGSILGHIDENGAKTDQPCWDE